MADLKFPNPMPHALAICGSGPAPLEWAQKLVTHIVGGNDEKLGAVLRIEPEKGTIKLEAAETIARFLSLQRLTTARVIVVNEAHTLNPQATNAMLKLVEEPPPHTHFLLVVPEVGLLLPTLRSRVQVIRVPVEGRPIDERVQEALPPAKDFLNGCVKRDTQSVKRLMESIEGREGAEFAARAMQEVLREWTVGSTDRNPAKWVELWRRARQMENDLHANVDRNLVFENFYLQVPNAMD